MLWLNVQVNEHKSFIIGSLYRHPSSPLRLTLESIEKTFNLVSATKKSFYCFGDFNVNLINKNNQLSKILYRLNLSQMVQEPTRTTKTSQTLLDLAITNNPKAILSTETSFSFSDHHSVQCLINIAKEKRKFSFMTYLPNEKSILTRIFPRKIINQM